jgi:phosphoribosylaminoimidazole-succinocarboxamide synthase
MSSLPEKVTLQLDKPCYTGSVQKLYEVPEDPDILISETTAGGSVFDVGTIFNIEGSDVGRAGFRHLVFQMLQNPESWQALSAHIEEENVLQQDESGLIGSVLAEFCKGGAPTHHLGMVDRKSGKVYSQGYPAELSNLTLIKKYEVSKPELIQVLGWHFYDYEQYHHKDENVIPLEYIVRLGVTSGSSILKKYSRLSEANKRSYLEELGVGSLKPWTKLERPIVDLTTKYEPADRNISRQEAALISGVDGDTFARSLVMAALGALLLQKIFAKMGLFLWDLKWEIARDDLKWEIPKGNMKKESTPGRSNLVFVDTIDTDSVRVTMNVTRVGRSYFVHFNKQAMRDYYCIMHDGWHRAVQEAKKIASLSGKPFTEILNEGQLSNKYPQNPVVDEKFLDIQKQKFNMILDFIKNQDKDLRKEAESIARAEIDYYESVNKIDEYVALNAV